MPNNDNNFMQKYKEIKAGNDDILAEYNNYLLSSNNGKTFSASYSAKQNDYYNKISSLKNDVIDSNNGLIGEIKSKQKKIDKLSGSKYASSSSSMNDDMSNLYTNNMYLNTAITSNYDNTNIYNTMYYKNIFFISMILSLIIAIKYL